MIPRECKRLAEVDFPIAKVSRHAAREKSIRHGHPSTLHLWWARRPLASSRAILLALLLPDPCDEHCPPAFKKAARPLLRPVGCDKGPTDADLREGLLTFIGDFANWDLAAKPAYLEASRGLVRAAHDEEPPLVVDPFAGGGSIPLEALRLGCDAFASDLNPVACLILKVMLEDIPRHGPALADELRRAGAEIKKQAEAELADLYPPDPDGATPIAYLWARTVRCEAPNCGAEIPLMRSFWLCKKEQRKVALRPLVMGGKGNQPPRVNFEVFEPSDESEVQAGTVSRAKATCLCCNSTLSPARVRTQLTARRGGADAVFNGAERVAGAWMTAVVTLKPGQAGRQYRLATEDDYAVVRRSQERLEDVLQNWERGGRNGPCPVPDEPTPVGGGRGAGRAFSLRRYGMEQWGDLFTARQKVVLAKLVSLTANAPASLAHLLGIALDRTADGSASVSTWLASGEEVKHVFARQALPIVWDFGESNYLSQASRSWISAIESVARVIDKSPTYSVGQVEQSSADQHPLPDESASVWFTDPPYYDAVPYADLSDFFLVWLKRTLHQHATFDDPFDSTNVLSPKAREA